MCVQIFITYVPAYFWEGIGTYRTVEVLPPRGFKNRLVLTIVDTRETNYKVSVYMAEEL